MVKPGLVNPENFKNPNFRNGHTNYQDFCLVNFQVHSLRLDIRQRKNLEMSRFSRKIVTFLKNVRHSMNFPYTPLDRFTIKRTSQPPIYALAASMDSYSEHCLNIYNAIQYTHYITTYVCNDASLLSTTLLCLILLCAVIDDIWLYYLMIRYFFV